MAESAAFTAVINKAVEILQIMPQIVGTASRSSYRLKEDIEWIERQMRHFKSCLKDAESKKVGSREVANLIIEMRDLALDIEDILYTYLPEMEKGPFRFVKDAACILCCGGTTNTFSQKIEKIKSRAEEIEAKRERCRINLDTRCRINLDTDGGNADSEVWNRRKEFLIATESMVVGREDKFQELKEKLRSSNPKCKMICIVGDAGVGKTTVGKKIYKEMRNEFTSSAIVYVSNKPRVQELLRDIAKQVGLEKEKMNENLKHNLLSLLNEKRYISDESSLIELKLLDQEKSWELFS
ncbi:unnamed protein product [Fraxinus pennsylvanica]|uniref:Uncharacterized protein n=1 Tax=Fraxinus pennsylvanica TaxID=56036 RepID=A0AAD2A7X4_9LAMI|nr:unnamed protein product [Fraxinus pennsylvanica]